MRKNFLIMTIVAGGAFVSVAHADRITNSGSALADGSTLDFLLGKGIGHSNQGYLNGPEHSNQGGSGDDGDDDKPDPRPFTEPPPNNDGNSGPSIGGGLHTTFGDDLVVAPGAFDGIVPLHDPFDGADDDTSGFSSGVTPHIPEPTSILLISLGGLTLLRRRR